MRALPVPVLLCLLAAAFAVIALLRGPEYDEGYTLLLTAGHRLPAWPQTFTAGDARAMLHGRWSLGQIADQLRRGDVHPPLYFWAAAIWRSAFGPTLLALRLLSVACGVAGLALVAAIAREARVPPASAVLLTAGSYAFAYTSVVARGFALAQLLTLAGALVLIRAWRGRGGLAAGLLFGAATFCNYLAAFAGAACLLWGMRRPRTGAWAVAGFMLWMPAELYFFLAQRSSRAGQFAPFDLLADAARLARLAAAALFGGLPLYAGPARPVAAAALAALAAILVGAVARRWRRLGPLRGLFALAALAVPTGLLALGAVFGNAPLELRYLAFAVPFAALLIADVVADLPVLCALVLTVQAAAVIGLAVAPQTMQPQARAAREATALGGLALLPRGNDGVGVVVPFVLAAPKGQRIMLVARGEAPAAIRARAGDAHRVVVVLLSRDADSAATLPAMRAAFDDPCWRAGATRAYAAAFDRVCEAP